jgi:hydroxymethylbilane synthase
MIRIGTRQSPLAQKQAAIFIEHLRSSGLYTGEVELIPLMTDGDRIQDQKLIDIGGKGLFTKEIEHALYNHEIDVAVHSYKDMATEHPSGLIIPCVLEREDPRDAWICPKGHTIETIPEGSRVGTSSLRRACQVQLLRPDLDIIPLRGNVGTRCKKIENGEADATLLAYAGLKRLNMTDIAVQILEPEKMLPAVAQGALAIQCREDDVKLSSLLTHLNHEKSSLATTAERSYLQYVDGSCRTPVAAYATISGATITLRGFLSDNDGKNAVSGEVNGPVTSTRRIGIELGEKLCKARAKARQDA